MCSRMASNTNRSKGHNAEREAAQAFRSIGYDKCQTSRYASRMHDDCAIDLVNIPFNVQIKAGAQKGLNASRILREIDERLIKQFPEGAVEFSQINLMIHRKNTKQGKRRDKYDTIVSMAFEDFLMLIKK